MQRIDGQFVFAASDLNSFLECRRLLELEEQVARGELERPTDDDQSALLLQRKGEEHERAYLQRLRASHDVVRLERAASGLQGYRDAEAATLRAMQVGARFIYQATFFDGTFVGHADFLRRVEVPSDLGAWSYEVVDTKLALTTRPYFILQLCSYSEHLLRLQGTLPKYGSIVHGDGSETGYRIDEFFAYYKRVKERFLAQARRDADATETYPLKRSHCDFCTWDATCTQKRERDDHLSLVARIRRDQIKKLESSGIKKLAELAVSRAIDRPANLAVPTYERLHDQAALQLRGRTAGPQYELLRHDPRVGFGLLPEPNAGDVYFDMEGDPMYEPGRKLEYLFGCWLPNDENTFAAFWAHNAEEEKDAFERFIDFIVARRRLHPAMHIYHYAPYERVALARLAQHHQTREDEVDDLLRNEVLVDLFAVVRQSVLISEESYSIKRFEQFYNFKRTTDVKRGDDSIVMFETWRLRQDQAILDDIEAYNRDDCHSTYLLHRWLLERRDEAAQTFGIEYAYRVREQRSLCHDEFVESCGKCRLREAEQLEDAKRSALERALLAQIPSIETEDAYRALPEFERAQYLIAHLLAYHRREDKPAYWQYFHRCENQDELVDFDGDAIGGLELCEEIAPEPIARSFIYTYRFPDQHYKIKPGKPHDPKTQKAVELLSIDDENNLLRIKRTGDVARAREVTALIPETPPPTAKLVSALTRIAEAFVDGSLRAKHPATYDLLAARDPRTSLGSPMLQPSHVDARTVSNAVQALTESYIFIQGPPGSGKSTNASETIADLLQQGKRVGVMSTGHKAVHNVLHKVEAVMRDRGARFTGLYKHSDESSAFASSLDHPCITSTNENSAFVDTEYQLAGGTAWLFAREDLVDAFDYLFIDEAGQVPLANAIAVAPCARNLVLLGDPSQLAQVSQGSHALHADDSVLQHLLADAHTVAPTRGIFLDHSFRMHPEICRFISESMYDGRLLPGGITERYRVESSGLSGSGLRFIPIEHDGNANSSLEEADCIVAEIAALLRGHVVDRHGVYREMRPDDIIVVTPYNAQRRKVIDALRCANIDVRVGTVDKFQGQEASVVFYSMATSGGEDAPRELDFLFEQNRFNVAISRAQAMSVLVCSPSLLDVSCRSVDQMRLVNLLCSYVERAGHGLPMSPHRVIRYA